MQILQGSKYCSAKFWFRSSIPENIQSTIAKVICLVGQNTSHTKRKSDTSYVKPCKVWIFWERYKIWENLPLKIWHYSVMSNFKWKIFQILWPSQNIRTLSPDTARTKEKFGQITCHFECASADNFLTNLIVGQIM